MASQISTSALQVGFIGLGDQGGPMAVAIAEGGFALHVWARRLATLQTLGSAPYTAHTSVAQLGQCDIVALCLTDDKDIWDVLEVQGLLAALKPGAIVVNHGTGDPAENVRIATRLADVGIGFLDAPVSGGRPGAVARTLTTIVGGDAQLLARCRSVFECYSRKIVLIGPAGSGQLGKLLNNALTMSNLDNISRILALAEQLGLDGATVVDMLAVSSGSSFILEALRNFTPELARHLQGLMKKDIEHFADGMNSYGLDGAEMRTRGLCGASSLVDMVESLFAQTTAVEA